MDQFFFLLLLINICSGILLLPYPLNLLFLTLSSSRWGDPQITKYYEKPELPTVTIQIPVYNEPRIIQSTLRNIANLLYPPDQLKVQIIDDSTDETAEKLDQEVSNLCQQGIHVDLVRRSGRTGYKAGALAHGLKQIQSDLVAIFDADFQVDPNFLQRSVHYFKSNPYLGALQTRWEHRNLHYSLFTRAMSIGLDGHFLVEKPGRLKRNAFITFNGSGGIWKRDAINTIGGWSSETLAEDLDLAYRAQIQGYEILYLRELTNSQEIPPTIRYWTIQQTRWAKGFSQNLRKNFRLFWQTAPPKSRIQGVLHLSQYSVPALILVNTTTGAILLFFPEIRDFRLVFFVLGVLFTIATGCGAISYAIALLRAQRPRYFILLIPLFLFWGSGLIVRMALGAMVGLVKKGGEFIRTPKFNLLGDRRPANERMPIDKIFFAEFGYTLILLAGTFQAVQLGGSYLTLGLYYSFLLLGTVNLIISELRHAL
ncbi:MAG: glycosyltransferase [Candidatus Thorarchaeota archaeon]